MLRRVLPLLCCGLFGCGGSDSEAPLNDPPPVSQLELFRSGTAAGPDSRLFCLTHDQIHTLPALHAAYVEEFINVPNAFGGGRMVYMGPSTRNNWVEYVPQVREVNEQGDPVPPTPQAAPTYDSCNGIMTLTDGHKKMMREIVWNTKERRLISVADRAVYLHDRPNMHTQMAASARATMPRRPVDEFEASSIEQLKTGHTLVAKTEANQMRLVGAICARSECLSCHKTSAVGDLLGAFTYTLTHEPIATEPENRLKDRENLAAESVAAIDEIEQLGGIIRRTTGGPVTSISFPVDRGGSSRFIMSPVRNPEIHLLANYPDLEELDLRFARINDESVPMLAKLTKLKKLCIQYTAISPAGIAKLQKALPGCTIQSQVMPVP